MLGVGVLEWRARARFVKAGVARRWMDAGRHMFTLPFLAGVEGLGKDDIILYGVEQNMVHVRAVPSGGSSAQLAWFGWDACRQAWVPAKVDVKRNPRVVSISYPVTEKPSCVDAGEHLEWVLAP